MVYKVFIMSIILITLFYDRVYFIFYSNDMNILDLALISLMY